MIKLFALIVPEEAHSPDLLENPTIRSVLKRPSGTSHSKVSEETHPPFRGNREENSKKRSCFIHLAIGTYSPYLTFLNACREPRAYHYKIKVDIAVLPYTCIPFRIGGQDFF